MPLRTKTADHTGLSERRVDVGLSILLLLQGFTLFVAIPLGSGPTGRVLLDGCHLSFAIVCIGVLTQHRGLQGLLVATVALLVVRPALGGRLVASFHLSAAAEHETIALVAFAFNGCVTALVARHVFGRGRVTAHRIRGAVLLYLNVAALFAIAYGALAMHVPEAFSGAIGAGAGSGTASFSYFSLATITTTGYGDLVPLNPIARSLANLEAVFGQLFPATLLARLVARHLAHESEGGRDDGKLMP